MPVKCFSIGPLETNCYLIYENGEAIAIDPGGDPKPIIKFIEQNQLKLLAICITHLHFDHTYGVQDLHLATNAPIYSPPHDAFLLEQEAGSGGMWGFPKVKKFEAKPFEPGAYSFGNLNFNAMHTPGHSPGSMSMYFEKMKVVFTGDVLFYRSIGRADLPGGDYDTLINSIKNEIFVLPPDSIVYPGHGPESSVEDEKNNNPYCGSFVR